MCQVWGEDFGSRIARKETIVIARLRRATNFKMNFEEIGWDGVNWIHLADDVDSWRAIVNAVLNIRVP